VKKGRELGGWGSGMGREGQQWTDDREGKRG
jgi:hypothetical protein